MEIRQDHRRDRRTSTVIFFLLYVIGLLHWTWFFNWGDVSLLTFDWRKESAYLDTLRMAIETAQWPLQWDQPGVQGTPNFLGIPEVSLAPDILLLPWLDNASFVLLHTLLFYSIGYVGLLWLASMLNASVMASVVLWGFFNFNGYITSHLATGHFQWLGYFLLPVFVAVLLRGVSSGDRGPVFDGFFALSMALVLAALFLNGSFHIAVWCAMFMAVLLPFRWKMWINVAVAIVGTIGLSAGRLLPAAVSFWGADHRFISGYPSASVLFDALTVLLPHTFEVRNDVQGGLAWAEFDLFVGITGFVLLAVFLAVTLWSRRKVLDGSVLMAGCLMGVLSLGSVYAVVNALPLPLVNAERVSTRFIIAPFIIALLAMTKGIDHSLAMWPRRTKVFILGAMPLFFYELFLHSSMWRVSVLEQSVPEQTPIAPTIVQNTDDFYGLSVAIGWVISCVSVTVIAPFLIRAWRRSRHSLPVSLQAILTNSRPIAPL